MKILVVSQHFWPENFRINDLVAELVKRGHDVCVLTGLPNYPEGRVFEEFVAKPTSFSRYAGARIVRVPMLPRGRGRLRLALNYLTFAISACVLGPLRLRHAAVDAIFVYAPSPITVGLPAIVLKWIKGAPIALWVLDLWPQSVEAAGGIRSKAVLGVAALLASTVYRGSDLLLAQSRSFAPHIAKYSPDPTRISYFPSWAEPMEPPERAAHALEVAVRPDLFNIVFAGNLGEAQDLPSVLMAAEHLRDAPVRWLIVGDGRGAEWMRSEVSRRQLSNQIVMPGRFALDRMPSFFRHADALLVSLRPDPVFALTIPGKMQTYLAAGIPVLAMLSGEGADVVRAAGAGYAVESGDSIGLAASVRKLMLAGPKERATMGARGREYSIREFDRDALISRLLGMLETLRNAKAKTVSGK